MNYTKLSSEIVNSSMWHNEDSDVRVVWVTMLALKGPDGIVRKNVHGLTRLAKVPLKKCQEAVAKFLAPDPESGSPEFEGRRIKEVEGGWLVLNHEKYRELGWSEEKKRYERERKALQRAGFRRKKKGVPAKNEMKYLAALRRGASQAELDAICAEGT